MAYLAPIGETDDRPAAIHCLDPLRDPRWSEFVSGHPNASVFHSVGWLRALHVTYGFEPIAIATSGQAGGIQDAVLFCSVRSWLTGSRLVSLPFSDHCEPLVDSGEALKQLSEFVERMGRRQGRRYVEFRPVAMDFESIVGFRKSSTFYHHRLDLRPSLDALFCGFHKDCVQRKIRKGEDLSCESGRTELLVLKLYDVLRLSRRRHHLPPPPIRWFKNLIECLGGNVCIKIASKGGQAIAGILTLSHGKSMIYKYGGSDAQFHKLGGMQLLLWKAIQEAKEAGAEELDLGRSDCSNVGLIAFKDRWAAKRVPLSYWRTSGTSIADLTEASWKVRYAKKLFAMLPDSALTAAGTFLSGHID